MRRRRRNLWPQGAGWYLLACAFSLIVIAIFVAAFTLVWVNA